MGDEDLSSCYHLKTGISFRLWFYRTYADFVKSSRSVFIFCLIYFPSQGTFLSLIEFLEPKHVRHGMMWGGASYGKHYKGKKVTGVLRILLFPRPSDRETVCIYFIHVCICICIGSTKIYISIYTIYRYIINVKINKIYILFCICQLYIYVCNSVLRATFFPTP